MILLRNGLDSKQKTQMLDKIDEVDGVKWSLGMNSLIGPSFPESMIPSNIKEMLESDNYEVQFVCSEYSSATDECNAQLAAIQDIVKEYSPESMVIGEAPLMKDLQDTTVHSSGGYRVCDLSKYGDPVLSGCNPSVRCKYRHRCDPAWRNG